jgi:hypothetical protein
MPGLRRVEGRNRTGHDQSTTQRNKVGLCRIHLYDMFYIIEKDGQRAPHLKG